LSTQLLASEGRTLCPSVILMKEGSPVRIRPGRRRKARPSEALAKEEAKEGC